ncbi:MAG: hypothetical protein N3G21_05455 [Candidatus Hydrogenedentes bacterium]|nr:hypothetical protein [Candidatus Hydrogenedentota bacterium]
MKVSVTYTPRVMYILVVFILFNLGYVYSQSQEPDYCNIPPCNNIIPGLIYTESFENSMRELYTKIPLLGGNPDNLDLDFDGMKDVAQARLFDTIMKMNPLNAISTRNCIYWSYVANRVKVEALAMAINAGWPSYLGEPPDLENLKTFFAALATMGNEEIINTILSALKWIIPDLPDLSLLELDGSNIVYLNAKGDADLDRVCNIGEYRAWVLTIPDDFNAFVSAAVNPNVRDYYGGCPDCGQGEGTGEGEGTPGPQCDMRSNENYFALLVLFGDTNADGKLSKNELKAFVNGILLELGWWLIDKDRDGYMSYQEFVDSNRLGGLLPQHLDADGDNKVTLTEIRQLSSKITQAKFDEIDIDDNGYLDCWDLIGPLPQSCYAEWCWSTCSNSPVSSQFESSLRSLYNLASWLGLNPDTADIDENGIADVAQARLLDYILAHPDLPIFCCVRNSYMNNRVTAQTKWNSLPFIGQFISSSVFIPVIAGVLTTGEKAFINRIVQIIDYIYFWGTFTIDEYDTTAGQYLASDGDPDFDNVCNKGEYTAHVTSPQNYDVFVASALDINVTSDGGGCPPCPEDYSWVYGGEAPCDITDIVHYYYILLMFGDTDGNKLLSRDELKAITGWSDTVLLGWYLVDTNGDGQLSVSEFSRVSVIYDLFTDIDINGDEVLILYELQGLNSSITQEQLNAVDLNQNGVLDCYDFEPYMVQEGEGTAEGSLEGSVEEGVSEGIVEGYEEGEGISEGVMEGVSEGVVEGIPEGVSEGVFEGVTEGVSEGEIEGSVDGVEEGVIEGSTEGIEEGSSEGVIEEGVNEGEVEGDTEGLSEGGLEGEIILEGEIEGVSEGSIEGDDEGEDSPYHSADTNRNWKIELGELLRVIQFFNAGGYHCALSQSEDGYMPGDDLSLRMCKPHLSDYSPQDWKIQLTELLRLIQFFNIGGYMRDCGDNSADIDGFCLPR